MGYFWTNVLENAVIAGRLSSGTVDVRLALLSRAPVLPQPDTNGSEEYEVISTMSDLVDFPGWEEVNTPGYQREANLGCTLTTKSGSTYLTLNQTSIPFFMTEDSQAEALAIIVGAASLGFAVAPPTQVARGRGTAYGAFCIADTVTVTGPNETAIAVAQGFDATCTSSTVTGDEFVVFVTDTPFRGRGRTIFQSGDSVSVNLDSVTGVRWYLGWKLNGTVLTVADGPIVLNIGSPRFESSRLQHVWMFPQRVNYIANPSFEYTNGWWQSTVGPVARLSTGEEFPSPYMGRAIATNSVTVAPQYPLTSSTFDYPADRLYLQSAAFYPRDRTFTFQMMAKGKGIVRVALAYYNRDYTDRSADWGRTDGLLFQEWTLNENTYTKLQGIRTMGDQGYEAVMLVEVRGILTNKDDFTTYIEPIIDIDVCVMEEGTLLDWEYFDGDSTYAATGDYSWYGKDGVDKQGKSYSLWYNNLRDINGRMFGRYVDDTNLYTSSDEQMDGLVARWVPAGVAVIPHVGALSTEDSFLLPVDDSDLPIPIELWPEQSQYFSIFEVVESTTTSLTIKVVGEGAYPISRAMIVSLGGSGDTITQATIAPRPWEAPGLTQRQIDAMKAELFDLSIAQTVTIFWSPVPGFNSSALHIERGAPESPPSVISYTLQSVAGEVINGYGEGFNASVTIRTSVSTGAATGAGFVSRFGLGTLAGTGPVTVTAYPPSTTNVTTSIMEYAAAVGSGLGGLIQYGVRPGSGDASATGLANNATTNSDTGVSTSAATGATPTATLGIKTAPATTGIGSGAAFNPAPIFNSAPAPVSALAFSYSQSGGTWYANATWTNPAVADLSKVWVSWYVNGGLVYGWGNVGGSPGSAGSHSINVGASGATVQVRVITEDTAGQQSTQVTSNGPTTYSPLLAPGVTVSQIGFDRMRVAWTNPGGNGLNYYNVVASGGGVSSNTNESGLSKDFVVQPGQTLSATVYAVDTSARSGVAGAGSAGVNGTAPSTPWVTAWDYSNVNISWYGSGFAPDGYAVERWDQNSLTWSNVGYTGGGTFTVPVWQDTRFSIRIRAYGTTHSLYSGELHVSIGHAAYDTVTNWELNTGYFAIYRNQTVLVYPPYGGQIASFTALFQVLPTGSYTLQSGTRTINYVNNDVVGFQFHGNTNPWGYANYPWTGPVTGGNGFIILGNGWTTTSGTNPHLEGDVFLYGSLTVTNPAVGNNYW